MSRRISVRLGSRLGARLVRIARLTARSKSSVARQGLHCQIQDFEDLYLARAIASRVAKGLERLIPLDDLDRTRGGSHKPR